MDRYTDTALLEIFHKQTRAVNFDTCYEQGLNDALAGCDESENPYQKGTKAYQYWCDGWFAGFYTQEEQAPADEVVLNKAFSHVKWISIASAAFTASMIGASFLDLAA